MGIGPVWDHRVVILIYQEFFTHIRDVNYPGKACTRNCNQNNPVLIDDFGFKRIEI